MEKKPASEWTKEMERALSSKVREFKTIGYRDVTVSGVLDCLETKVWKGNPEKYLHEIIQDVFHLQASTYMNHVRIGALRTEKSDLMSSIHALTGSNEE